MCIYKEVDNTRAGGETSLAVCAGHGRKLKFFCHSTQLSRRVCLHLAHDLAAMDRRGNFARSKCRGDPFGEHTGNDETHAFHRG